MSKKLNFMKQAEKHLKIVERFKKPLVTTQLFPSYSPRPDQDANVVVLLQTSEKGINLVYCDRRQNIRRASGYLYNRVITPACYSSAYNRDTASLVMAENASQIYFDWLIGLDSYLKQVHVAMCRTHGAIRNDENRDFATILPKLRAKLNEMNSVAGPERLLTTTEPAAVAFIMAGEALGREEGEF